MVELAELVEVIDWGISFELLLAMEDGNVPELGYLRVE